MSKNNKIKQVCATKGSEIQKLPENFAQDLFNYEIETDKKNVQLSDITGLLEIYRIGVEYYENLKSDKYLVFKNKIQSLLLKPNVQECLQFSKLKENMPDQINLNKQLHFEKEMHIIQQKVTQEQIFLLIQEHNQKNRYKQNIVDSELNRQTQNIQERLQNRKFKSEHKVQDLQDYSEESIWDNFSKNGCDEQSDC